MTRKNRRERLRESLSSAVRPPEPDQKLDKILGRYATAQPMLGPAPHAAEAWPETPTTTTSGTSGSSTTSTTRELEKERSPAPVAPARDYMKVANSIGREAVPGGMFGGKSKQLYDYLYSRTRGAITPAMKVRISNNDLMKGADIGSEITLRANVERLCRSGLVKMVRHVGTHEGNEYTVFLPEELPTGTSGTSTTSGTDTSQNLLPLVPLESSGTSTSVSPEDSTTSGEPKTSFKTNTESDDDEAYARLLARLRQAVKEVTGRDSSPAEAERWEQLAELLVTELKIAAGRTTVSSVPAFLTEHLRRRLWKKEKRQVEEEGKSVDSRQSGAAKVDASKCPDCFGTGMWYPSGFEKGVAKCAHEKLIGEE